MISPGVGFVCFRCSVSGMSLQPLVAELTVLVSDVALDHGNTNKPWFLMLQAHKINSNRFATIIGLLICKEKPNASGSDGNGDLNGLNSFQPGLSRFWRYLRAKQKQRGGETLMFTATM